MTVSREIGIYQKDGDELIDNFQINLSINRLIEIFNIDIEDDPNVYKEYDINENEYLQLKELVPELSKYDFNHVFMSYECYQVG